MQLVKTARIVKKRETKVNTLRKRKTAKIDGSNATDISRSVERIIREGRLKPGESLPPVRSLAEELKVSPTTVNAAYRNLRTRGMLVGSGRQGTRVSASPPVLRRLTTTIPMGVTDLANHHPDPTQIPPLGPILASIDWTPSGVTEENERALLEWVQGRFADDKIKSSSVAIVTSCTAGLERALDAHLKFGDTVLLEDPCPIEVLDLCRTLGLNTVELQVDADGPVLDSFTEGLAKKPRAVIVSSRAQDPSSAAITKNRALRLKKELADHPNVLLVEFDRVGDAAGVPCFSIRHATTANWVFIRSFSFVLGSSLSLAAVAGDTETIGRIEGRLRVGGQMVSPIVQKAVLTCHASGQAILLEAIHDNYHSRRKALVESLQDLDIEAWGTSGHHVWIPVPEEYRVAQSLRDRAWAVMPGERFRLRSGPGIRVVTTRLSVEQAGKFAQDLADILHGR